jgi:PKD repeat protein
MHLVVCILPFTQQLLAATRYVNVNNTTPLSPYTTWATAATNIQIAIDAASAGDLVLVTNGVYQTGGRAIYGSMTNRVAVNKALTVQSVNGPAVTIIQGVQLPGTLTGNGAMRCVFLTNNAILSGFTLTNGATRGVAAPTQEESGGGVWCSSSSSVVSNCMIVANTAAYSGGGVYQGTLRNCKVVGNSAGYSGGGTYGAALTNCAVIGNSAVRGGGVYNGPLNNCTLINNFAENLGGGYYSDGYPDTVRNSVLYYNTAQSGANYAVFGALLSSCCTTPLPLGFAGNITTEPQMASLTHLSSSSPCRGAGSSLYTSGLDIDGEAWGTPPSMGCDEYKIGSVTGALNVSIQASYTNVGTSFVVDFTALIDGRTSSSRWDFGDGTIVTNRPLLSHSWPVPGDYPVLLKAFNESNPSGATATLMVHVVVPPVHYVALDSTNPVPPYTSWATAATNIQDAIDATAVPGAIVLTANGVYDSGARVVSGATNRVAITKPVTVQSLTGPAASIILGYQVPGSPFGSGAVRCAYLMNGAALVGFTLTNGGAGNLGSGGGAWCASTRAALSNCVICGNAAFSSGGGVNSGTLWNCAIFGNFSVSSGGGAVLASLNNCTVTGNSAGSAGGVISSGLTNCIVCYNAASSSPNYAGCTFSFSCSTPLPAGTGNIGIEPGLGSLFHLASGSPCLGAGNSTNCSGADIDGEAWSHPPSMGCDEFRPGAVTGPLTASIQASDTNLATGFAATFTAWIFGRTTSSQWDFGDGTFVTNRPVVTHSWAIPGDYIVTLRGFNEDHPSGVSASVLVHVANQPVTYVALDSSTPAAPYASWMAAATNIQDAIDSAYAGGTVLVSNGVYQTGGRVVYVSLTNRVAITRPVLVQSVNGPDVTIIQGASPSGDSAVRCVFMLDGATLAGFTMTNGATRTGGEIDHDMCGGAVWCASPSSVISNCVLSGNSANFFGGAARSGTFYRSIISSNACSFEGGGAYASTLINCLICSNSADFGAGGSSVTASNCIFNGNVGTSGGGSIDSAVYNSVFINNSGTFGAGADSGFANNSLFYSNVCSFVGGGAEGANLTNCTLVGNLAGNSGGGAIGGTLYNCVLVYNFAPSGANYSSGNLNYCCTTPLPSGTGNITNEPLFFDTANGNFRLQANSPCINAGYNGSTAPGLDLDGNPRIRGGTVDMGAYEFQFPTSGISYAWLQQFGLPTDGSADFADTDSDGMNNWQEWVAGTSPTDPLSRLRMLSPVPSPTNAIVRWESVSGRKYFVQRGANLNAQPTFATVATNLTGVTNVTTYTDKQVAGPGPFFYRVGIQQQ